MPTIDLCVKASRRENRLRFAGGDVVDWVIAGKGQGRVIRRARRWRIVRVTNLSRAEAKMLVASDPPTIRDRARRIRMRRRMYKLPLRLWFSGARDTERTTVYDYLITRDDLFAVLILKPEELRDADGDPIDTLEPDHDIDVDDR